MKLEVRRVCREGAAQNRVRLIALFPRSTAPTRKLSNARRRADFRIRHLAAHLSRGLVLAQTLIDHLAQQIVLGPGEKLHLRDELGPDPMNAA